MKTPRMALAALVVCAALSACGGQGAGDGTPAPSPSGGSPVTDATSTGPADPADPTAAVPSPPVPTKTPGHGPSLPPGPGAATLTGTVEAGVEPGCRLLDGHQLVGGPADVLTPGTKVTVTGQAKPDMITTCQQGIPFVVESARRA
ncbi:hypothetical protein OOK41_29260 [Micromonospora sp. NBC_01655]|uniref:hypothetical protein n=1 Tax=unclassified Micromonospora TaxID=2617518 RepID=UPI000E42D466|nr:MULTISPECIES: hypothetical protein [unclassified Micromonospora]MCX4474350.1 hypothetical protein [Micromonospora sp. NBC_01655]